MQEIRDEGKEGFRTGGISERRDSGKEGNKKGGFRTGGMRSSKDVAHSHEGYRKGGMLDSRVECGNFF